MTSITCLACGSTNIHQSLDLGLQPLANSYLKDENDNESKFPLGVLLCHDCYHLQLSYSVDPSLIYKNYLYVSGTTKTLKEYSDWFANFVTEKTGAVGSILDIGCNDGTQLDSFKSIGWNTEGIDPAENIYETSSKKHKIYLDFFTKEAVAKINKTYDAITGQNVMAHNPNPLEFLTSCAKLMHNESLLFIQTSQANMVLNNEFDTIYHEHINFFNAYSMSKLALRAKLHLIDVIKTPIHGISYLFVFSKQKTNAYHMKNIIDLENSQKLYDLKTYKNWETIVKSNTKELKNTLLFYKENGYKVIGYGAAAKGNTLLNYIKYKLDYIIDDNQLKQNHFTPGMHIPIVSSGILNTLVNSDKVLFVPLAWNFFDEIKQKIKNIRNNQNDKFCKYFPKVEVHDI